ncbi:hypothetical protein Catovirus_2_301 [Catovirus CTV1]|uniref:Uncharacterized protein n=1 Tax=Catovirus CTV1 TaxID=1977631 RepID=A0A1V0SCB8_9VIRU|nr:hypothetical protein Catovirus_2_301 [Catovirus CTV1]
MSGVSIQKEKEAFFGGDGRSRLFLKFFFAQGNYSQVINGGNADSIIGTDAWGVMSAMNHEDNAGMNDNDVHPDFTDFIVQTALFHREIDKSTKTGTIMDPLARAINDTVYDLLNVSNNFGLLTNNILPLNQPALTGSASANTIASNLPSGTSNNLNTIIAILKSIGEGRVPGSSSVDENTILNFNAPVGSISLKDYIDSYVGKSGVIGVNELREQILSNPKVLSELKNLANFVPNKKAFANDVYDSVKKTLYDVMLNRFTYIINNINNGALNNSILFSNKFKKDMIDEVIQAVKLGFDKVVSKNFNKNFVTASNKYVEAFIDKVFGNWDNLSDDSKNFYKNLITLEKLGTSGWEPVTDAIEIEAKNVKVAKNNYRVNLRKVSIGEAAPFFWNLIPKVPSVTPRIHYYDSIGKMLTVDLKTAALAVNREDILREMYLALYQGNPFALMPGLPSAYDPLRNKSDFPKLWVDKVVRYSLFNIKEPSAVPQSKFDDDDDEIFDLVTQDVWKRSGDKLYTVRNGKKIMHNLDDPDFVNMLTSSNKCFTTGAFGDKENCRLFMNECLLDHNPKNIMSCIRVMEKQDFAQSAKQEINNMTPIVALNLLKRFGFRTHEAFDSEANSSLTKVEKVGSWLKSYMKKKFDDATVQTAIEGNEKILQYLNLVVDFVNANPSILNPGYGGSTEEKVGKIEPDSYAAELGIPLRRDNTRAKALYDIEILGSSFKNGMFGLGFKKPMILQLGNLGNTANNYNFANLNTLRSPFGDFISPSFGTILPVQNGGRLDPQLKRLVEGTSGASLMEAIIYNLLTQIKQHNKELGPEFMTKLHHKLELMKKMEKQMVQNIKYIAEYTKLLDAFGDRKYETLSEKNLRDIVNSNANLYKRHGSEELSMVNLLKTLYKLAYGSDDTESDNMKEININNILN